MIRGQIKKDIIKIISSFPTCQSLAMANRKFPISNSEIEITRSSNLKFGDYSTNIALKLKHISKQSPMEFAKLLARSLQKLPYVKKLEVKQPGFINFFIKDEVWQKQVDVVLRKGKKYGSNTLGRGKKARVEFISANPTGPLHFGNARGGPIGDVLALVLEFSGYRVLREYLHNDIGGQVEKLGRAILNVSRGQKLEDQEYKGKYLLGLVKRVGKIINSKEAGKKAVSILLKEILKDTQNMGIKFDKVYPESNFVDSGQTQKVIGELFQKKFLKKKEGALWFAPNDQFLKDRECVVVKSDGSYTYFANDIAYHRFKFDEGYDLVIDVLGANHHGHVPRLKAAIEALGFDLDKFHVILYQWVRFKRGQEKIKMAKRLGTFVTVREVLKEVGKDALRFLVLMHDANSHIDFDLDLAREASSKNPVYYVQYAHARIASILRRANSKFEVRSPNLTIGYNLLTTSYELDLIKQISRLPELVEDISKSFAVNRLTTYAIELADSFHRFYENCPVLEAEDKLKIARIGLIKATQIVLQNTLGLLGVSVPEKM